MSVYKCYDEFFDCMEYGGGITVAKSSRLCGETSSCAFSSGDTLTLTVRVPRVCCACKAVLKLYRDDDMSNFDIAAERIGFGDDADIFALTLELHGLCPSGNSGGLFYYTVGIDTPWGWLYKKCDGSFTPDRCGVDCEQLTIYESGYETPSRFKGGMMYQIFPDRFSRGGVEIEPGDGKLLNCDWKNGIPQYAQIPGGEVANNIFFGGNLWGIADGLDYIKSLGVNILYLCPIFEAASNHRYDTGDFMKIDNLLGGEAAFDNLLSELKKRGMLLILDGVFNHTGADSLYFNKFGRYDCKGAYNSKQSQYYKWYTFDKYPEKYRCWWGVDILPEIKSDEESYREFICGDNGVLRHYLRKGIDGWRIDVADELSDVFLDDMRAAVKAERADSIILGEVWEDASNKIAYDKRRRYLRGKQLDSVMNYPLKDAVIEYVTSGDSSKLRETARTVYTHYPKQVCDVLMNFLGTHDTERIITVLADVGARNMTNAQLSVYRLPQERRNFAIARLEIAWALLAAFPGIPCIYYGDESGTEGGRDPFNRMPLNRDMSDETLLAFYRKIGEVRAGEAVFADGEIEIIETGVNSQLLFKRFNREGTIYVAANLSAKNWNLEFETAPKRLLSEEATGAIAMVKSGTVEYFKL